MFCDHTTSKGRLSNYPSKSFIKKYQLNKSCDLLSRINCNCSFLGKKFPIILLVLPFCDNLSREFTCQSVYSLFTSLSAATAFLFTILNELLKCLFLFWVFVLPQLIFIIIIVWGKTIGIARLLKYTSVNAGTLRRRR